MIFANFWLFREIKTEFQPQRPGGGSPGDPRGVFGHRGPPRSRIFLFCFTVYKVVKNDEFTWLLHKTSQNGSWAGAETHL